MNGTRSADGPSVVIIGGGLAGLAAAIGAADAGWRVTVVEARPRLGGLTHSFTREVAGERVAVDNGQHVFLRCCSAYRAFLHRLGVAGQTVLLPLDVPVVDPATRRKGRLRRDPLPAPLHLLRSLAGYPLLSLRERWTAARAITALRRVDRNSRAVDQRSFGDWLAQRGVPQRAVDRLIDVFTVATLNAPAALVSLGIAAMVFQDGLLTDRTACDIGYATVPLGELHGSAAGRLLGALGVRVLLRTSARSVMPQGDRWQVEVADPAGVPRILDADAVVVAVPHDRATRLLPPGALPVSPGLLHSSPIINVHVIYDRRVLDRPFLASVESPAQFIFDRTTASGLAAVRPEWQYLAVSVSAATRWIREPVAAIRAVFLPAVQEILPDARTAEVIDFFVTREPQATFLPEPGSAAYRLGTRTRLPGLFLAGAWTDTGWPATMEGAVRSGWAAAAALGELFGRFDGPVVDLRGEKPGNVAAPREDPAGVEA